MRIYLAGPIMQCSDEQATGWRSEVKERLSETSIECLDPMARDFRENGAKENMNYIVEEDLRDIDRSDVLLANVWKVSAGTSMEIFYASHVRGIPVITVVPKENPVPIWIRYHSTVCRTMDEALELLREYENAAIPGVQ